MQWLLHFASFKKSFKAVFSPRILSAHMIDDGPHSQQMWGSSSPNAGVSNPTLPLQVMFLAPGNAWPDSSLTAQKRCNLSILDTANKQQRKGLRQLYLSLPSTLSRWQVLGEPHGRHTKKETYFLGNKPKGALAWEWRLSACSNTHKKELNTSASGGTTCTSFHFSLNGPCSPLD